MLTYQVLGKSPLFAPSFSGVCKMFLFWHFWGIFLCSLEVFSYLCPCRRTRHPKRTSLTLFCALNIPMWWAERGFFLAIWIRRTGEPKNSLPSWLSLWRAGAIALLASGWGLGASHKSAPITLTWSDADGGVFHSIYVFSFQFLWYFPRVYVTLPPKLGLTNYSPL